MNFRPIVALPLVLTSCAEPNTSDTQHALQDAGRTGSSAFNEGASSEHDATTHASNDSTFDGGGHPAPNDDSAVSSPSTSEVNSEMSVGQPTTSDADAGSNASAPDASLESDTTSDTQATGTNSASSDEPTETPGCGNGEISALEQCDDANTNPNDGCSPTCRIEQAFECEGEPSVCSPTVCGNGTREGVEDCDDGNADAFDGCSPTCVNEPSCSGSACSSTCGDGLVVNEECDDGNVNNGDGCSETCTVESDFTCVEAPCEQLNGACVLRVSAIHRDFADSQPDFGIALDNVDCTSEDPTPLVRDYLDADNLPVFDASSNSPCVEGAASFARWFREGTKKIDELVLFDNGAGGFVNRFGANGEQLVSVLGGSGEQQVQNATSLETCPSGCEMRTRDGLQCDNVCRPAESHVDSVNSQLYALRAELDVATDAAMIAELEAEIAELELELPDLIATADNCVETCEQDFQAQVDACVDDCKPCSYNSLQWCTGGEYVHADGTPLYFPVDDVTGPTSELVEAKLPPEYGYEGWPSEDQIFPDAPSHNFSFTTELRSWFRYTSAVPVELAFMSDDDLFVFINGRLALDLGGAHTPLGGTVLLNATAATLFGLTAGNVYEIAVFKAERQYQGSSLLVTLPPSAGGKSVCTRATTR